MLHAPESSPMAAYEPRVDQPRCIGCGLCPDMLGEVFRLPDARGRAYVHDPDAWESMPDGAERLESTAYNCPTGAILIEPEE